ncbi:MAG: molybdopterin-dependent oxidoreductase [Xanthobacteraceae bacterium]|nr:molybdopterin-dependent oxidoreductase [Xanthobacteraceae bacterium]
MTSGVALSRRSFLVGVSTVGGGLALALAVPFGPAPAAEEAPEVTAWLLIGADNSVVIRVARAEMGQGAQTGLAMLVAEELECDWATVRTEFVSPEENLRRGRVWGDMSTGASRSIASSQLYLRRAGAIAREMLIAAAAARWNVPATECTARMSAIRHKPSGRSVTFGVVAEDAAKIAPPADVALKEPGDWQLAGRPRRRLDVRDKVTARTVYAIDVRLPDMLYAAIAHCPVFGGTLKSVDESAIAAMKGVRRVVRLRDGIAVVADSWWHAKRALEVLPIMWDDRGNGGLSSGKIAEAVRAALDAETSQVGRADGDVVAGLARAARRIEADYTVPFLAHATMEPQTCTAHVKDGRVEVWAPTQDATTALVTAASAAGVASDKVAIHGTMLGGGFGRRGAIQEFVRQAVLVAKEVEQPVKLVWSREEDMKHDYYRPFGMARMVAGLDADGMPIAWKVRLTGPSFVAALVPGFGMSFVDRSFLAGLGDEMAYEVPNYLVDYVVQQTPVPLGVWRAINYTHNTFYKESFIDEMAHAAAIDPYLYRRRLLSDNPKNLDVLDAAAKHAGWFTPPPQGVFRGIAVTEACGSFCAQVAEVSVERGAVRVHRVVSAIDCGHVVNPLSIEMQTQGAVIFALTAALHGEITIKDGGVEQGNFDDYEMFRMADAPNVETVIVPSGDFWGGVGEPPVPPVAPALCNAIFAATGRRIRQLPIKNCDLSKPI